jgi:uracil-DNA glycosylase
MDQKEINIEASWKAVLGDEFEKDYFKEIKMHLINELKAGQTVYPPGNLIFNAFNLCPIDQVKVVIIGQDPYHGPGQAMGLSFSVPGDVKVPASLKNIYKEIKQDVGIESPNHGDLSSWAKQGVFLLNAMLTVRAKSAGSHAKIGWQNFTDEVIRKLSDHRENLVFLLWGNFAKSKKSLIDESKHFVLESAHPSPLAGNRFFGNHHFSGANSFLREKGLVEIDWQLK